MNSKREDFPPDRWPERKLGTIFCRCCGEILSAPAKYDLCPSCIGMVNRVAPVLPPRRPHPESESAK